MIYSSAAKPYDRENASHNVMSQLPLKRYFKSIIRWWWLILLSTAIATISSYVANSQKPRIFQTTTTLMVGQVGGRNRADFTLRRRLAESYAEIARQEPVLQATVESLELGGDWQNLLWQVDSYHIPDTQLFSVSVQNASPQVAVAIADEIAQQLILQSPATSRNDFLLNRGQFVQDQLDNIEGQIQSAQADMEELEVELKTTRSASKIEDIQTKISDLKALISQWQNNYRTLVDFLEVRDDPDYLSIIETAQLPSTPISPDVKTNVPLATAVGFMLAVGAALLLEYLDDTIKTAPELGTGFGLNVLGNISRISSHEEKDKLLLAYNPFSPLAEAYKSVCNNLEFTAINQPVNTIAITSANSGEGKSSTVANLGVSMAMANLRTIIVDADLRRPSLHKIFSLPNTSGLSDLFLSKEVELENYLQKTNVDNLQVLTSGPLPFNTSELLGSQRMVTLLPKLQQSADVILFDTPPVLAVTDGINLGRQVDGVVLVVCAERTRCKDIQDAIRRLQAVKVNILGGLLNQTSGKSTNQGFTPKALEIEEG